MTSRDGRAAGHVEDQLASTRLAGRTRHLMLASITPAPEA